ncbi:(3S)-malyl-CoA thioesterase [bacterium YEK0313]|nr:(3S)-malyl-CoA thioesterase [bacterium YEK0313]
MRSMLFVPADSEKKLGKGLETGADALILDLEDSVAAANKAGARATARAFLEAHVPSADRPLLMVRVNALDTGLTDDDLQAVVAAKPDAIMLPKAESGADVVHLDAKLNALEALAGIPEGHVKIVVVATETARAVFNLGSYQGASPRLSGLTWGAEDLSADIGSETNRASDGRHTEPFRIARSLCLFGAVAAGVQPIDTVFPAFRDSEGLRRECEEARRDGFTGKMAIHPAQVAVINEVFTPSAEAVAEARRVIAAFAANPSAGVVNLDGEMFDRPHLTRAERLIARLGR